MEHIKSQAAFEEARQYIPGGVNSPVRSFRSVGGVPPFISGGKGSKIYDIDGNEYIDYVMSYGPLLMGHVPDCVTDAIKAAAEKGTSSVYGYGPHGQQRYRSNHERFALSTRLHRP
mgnify:CR=1 FL=1